MTIVTAGWGRTKPPPGLPVNLGHPLGRYARAIYPFNEGSGWRVRNAAYGGAFPGIFATASGDPTLSGSSWRRGPRGVCTYHDNSGTGDAVSGRVICTRAQPQKTTWTIAGRWFCPSGMTGNGSLIGAESAQGIQIRGAAANVLELLVQQDTNMGASTGTWVADAWNDIGVVRGPGSIFRFYINGLDAGGGTDSTTFNTASTLDIAGNAPGEVANGIYTEFVYVFDGIAATAQQMKQIRDMPYDLIWKPHWIGAFQAAAAGGFTPRLPLLGVG